MLKLSILNHTGHTAVALRDPDQPAAPPPASDDGPAVEHVDFDEIQRRFDRLVREQGHAAYLVAEPGAVAEPIKRITPDTQGEVVLFPQFVGG